MAFSLPISLSDSLTVGKYLFTFNEIVDFSGVPNLLLPIEIPVGGKRVLLSKIERDENQRKLYLTVDILENPIPVAIIAGGIFVLLALAGGYMVLEKVEAIVDSPVADIAIVGGVLLVVFMVVKFGFK